MWLIGEAATTAVALVRKAGKTRAESSLAAKALCNSRLPPASHKSLLERASTAVEWYV